MNYDTDFAGPFTKNDQLTAAPFTDSFYYIPNVTASVANQVLPALNGVSVAKRSELEKQLWGRGHVESRYRTWLQDMDERQVGQTTNLTLGYVTTDVRRLSFCALRGRRTDRPFRTGVSRGWRRHAPRPTALLLSSNLHRLQPAQRDGRYPDRSGLCRLYRERRVDGLEWGSEHDHLHVGRRFPVHAYVG